MIHKGALIRIGAVLMMSGLVLAACGSSNKPGSSSGTTQTTTGSASSALDGRRRRHRLGLQGHEHERRSDVTPGGEEQVHRDHLRRSGGRQQRRPRQGRPGSGAGHRLERVHLRRKLMPSNYADLVRQAIAAHVNGIILDAIDCDTVKGPLQQAKAAGIAVTAMYAFDCNDPHAGGGTTSLFDGITNYGAKNSNLDAFTESYGSDQANYIIAKSDNKAKIIAIQDPEFTVLYYTLAGFPKTIAASHGSQIIATLDITQQDILDGNIVTKIQAELQRYPDATWIKSPFTYATTIGIVPALGTNPNHIQVMGGEGFHDELDDIRSGKISATNAISSDWTGWAAVDTLNSIFNHTKPVDSGIGWTLVDATHNLPTDPASDYIPPVDYKTEYKKAWGVAG